MGPSDLDLERLADQLSSAPLRPSLWPEILVGLSRAGGGWGTHLFGLSGGPAPDFSFSDAIADESMTEWLALGGMNPVLNPRARLATLRPALQVIGDDHLASAGERRANVFYNDFYPRYDAPHMVASSFLCGADLRVVLAVFRSRRQGGFGDNEAPGLTLMLPHVQDALRLQSAFEHRGGQIVAGALDGLGEALLLVTGDGRIIEASSAGEEALRLGRFVQSRGGRLTAATEHSDDDLGCAIQRAAEARGLERRSSGVVLRDADGGVQIADVAPAPAPAYALGSGPRVIVKLQPRPRPEAKSLLRRAYGLTEAEAVIALALTDLQSLNEIAETRRVSTMTIRNQLRSIFLKVGVGSQAALVKAVCKIAG